jgi:signal transduction histidine kinase
VIAFAVACVAATIAIQVVNPTLPVMEYDDLREGQLEIVGAVSMAVAASVLLGRFGRHGSSRVLLLTAALFVMAAENTFAAIATPLVDSLAANPFATWTAAAGGALGALLLITAFVMPDRTVVRRTRAVIAVLAGSIAACAAVVLACYLLRGSLPRAFDTIPATIGALRTFPEHGVLLVVEALTATAWLVAAVSFAHAAGRHDDALMRWLSCGAVLAATAFVNYALFPSQFTELLASGDLFFLAAILVILLGAVREITSTEAELVRAAVSVERQRVASELRAGVAQELALVAARADWIARRRDVDVGLGELAEGVERALDESRGAIASLVRPVDEPVADAVGRAAREVADRLRIGISLEVDDRTVVSREWRDALVRLTREAVSVAVRHAGATHVRVELQRTPRVVLRLSYDGRLDVSDGSEPNVSVDVDALRERAEALGATFALTAQPNSGAVVEVVLP